MKQLLRFGALVASASVLALLSTGVASAGPAESVTVPVSGNFFNFCTGEDTFISGINHFVTQTTVTPEGGIHVVMLMNAIGFHGVGLVTGTRYNNVGTIVRVSTFDVTPGSTTEVTLRLRMVSEGPASDIVLNEMFHVTFNANGVMTADIESFSDTCT